MQPRDSPAALHLIRIAIADTDIQQAPASAAAPNVPAGMFKRQTTAPAPVLDVPPEPRQIPHSADVATALPARPPAIADAATQHVRMVPAIASPNVAMRTAAPARA